MCQLTVLRLCFVCHYCRIFVINCSWLCVEEFSALMVQKQLSIVCPQFSMSTSLIQIVTKTWFVSLLCICICGFTHTHTHLFNGPLSGTTWVSRYQEDKTNLDFTAARDSEWQWNPPGHMQVCTSLQTDKLASTPPLFFTGRMPFLPPNQQC